MEDFTETPTLKVNGSIGTKIAKELNLNLSGSDTMTMTIKLGDNSQKWGIIARFSFKKAKMNAIQLTPIEYQWHLLYNGYSLD